MKYLALAVSTLAFLAWLYGGYLIGFAPDNLVQTVPAKIEGIILLVPAVIWWGVSLLNLGKQRKWIWVVSCLVLLPLGPLVYDMYRARANTT